MKLTEVIKRGENNKSKLCAVAEFSRKSLADVIICVIQQWFVCKLTDTDRLGKSFSILYLHNTHQRNMLEVTVIGSRTTVVQKFEARELVWR